MEDCSFLGAPFFFLCRVMTMSPSSSYVRKSSYWDPEPLMTVGGTPGMSGASINF